MRLPEIADGPPEKVLREFGVNYLEQLLDPESLALYRVVLGETSHIRHLGPRIFKAGPGTAAAALAKRLRSWQERGELALDEPDRAASLFLAMVEGDLHRSAIMWNHDPSAEQIAANVDAAVALFLHGAQPASRPEGVDQPSVAIG